MVLYYRLTSFRKARQLYFLFFLSSCLFFLEVVVNVFDYFRKPNSLFSKFCVNCLLMYYFVYCINCALKDVNEACYCSFSLVALRVPEMWFWPVKTRKNVGFFEMHTCHCPGAQIWFRHKWRQLVTASLLLLRIGRYGCLPYWIEFFSAVFHVLDWSFFLLHFDGNVCNWIAKVIWPRMNWFWVFFVEKWLLPLTSNLYGLKSDGIAQLLFFFDDMKFFRCLVWEVFCYVV